MKDDKLIEELCKLVLKDYGYCMDQFRGYDILPGEYVLDGDIYSPRRIVIEFGNLGSKRANMAIDILDPSDVPDLNVYEYCELKKGCAFYRKKRDL